MSNVTPENLADHFNEEDSTSARISFGDFLKARRSELGRSQRQMNLSSAHISQLETGNITSVTPATLLRVTEAYEVSITDCIVAGVEIDEDLIYSARALMVGEAILALPDAKQKEILGRLSLDQF